MTRAGAVRLVGALLGVGFLAAAVTVALSALPVPAAGGTCGPSTSSESALAAFVNPASIGAGPEPSAASGGRSQWVAFVQECQSSTDTRMAQAGTTFVAGLVLGLGLPWMARRRQVTAAPDDAPGGPPPGWYPDPAGQAAARWWDGRAWGEVQASGHPVETSVPLLP